MVGWHHQLNGHEFEQTPENGQGQGSLACCSPWGYKESDVLEPIEWPKGSKASCEVWRKDQGLLSMTSPLWQKVKRN